MFSQNATSTDLSPDSPVALRVTFSQAFTVSGVAVSVVFELLSPPVVTKTLDDSQITLSLPSSTFTTSVFLA